MASDPGCRRSAAGGSSRGDAHAAASGCPPDAATACAVVRLRRRREFLAARHGRRVVTPGFVLQAARRPDRDDGGSIGLGFTVSRKVGKAVARNRARRRLREAARAVFPGPAQPGTNYVIVARASVLTCPFDRLLHDLRRALERAGRTARASPGSS